MFALWATLSTLDAVALEAGLQAPPVAAGTPSAGVSSSSATTPLAPAAPSAALAPESAAAATPAPTPEAGVELGERVPNAMSTSAVAGIPLEDGGELVLGPEEKVSSDDHNAAAARFQHMRKDGKLAATSDLDREVPRILKREQAGDIRGALLAARAALTRMPDHQNLRQITARLQIANRDFGSALLTLAPLLEIDRDNWLPFYWAGIAELMQLNLDNARAYLARASQLDADRAEPWIARAVVEQEAGNFAGSLQLFAVARQRSPARAEILTGIAYSQAMLEQSDGVLQRQNSSPEVEAIVSQPAPAAAATPDVARARPQIPPQSFRNSPALASGMGVAARALMP
jgi:tetratricopeptide (TPR) repeat protein